MKRRSRGTIKREKPEPYEWGGLRPWPLVARMLFEQTGEKLSPGTVKNMHGEAMKKIRAALIAGGVTEAE
ncbi:MAG: hypothetical protein QM754_00610 [Tepidisphaeraceae bacterium]